MATGGQFSWPSVGSSVAAYGQFFMAANIARLSAFIRNHIGIDGHYAFHLPDLGGTHRPLRNPDDE